MGRSVNPALQLLVRSEMHGLDRSRVLRSRPISLHQPPAMTVLSVRHITTYRYRQPVSFGEHRMMLRPRDSFDQKLLESQLVITPEPTELRWMLDVFGNCVAIANFGERADELRFESSIWL